MTVTDVAPHRRMVFDKLFKLLISVHISIDERGARVAVNAESVS